MFKAALALIAVFALGSAANELIPNSADLHPLQPDGQNQIFVQKKRFRGTDFGVMYKTEGTKALPTGYCMWQNSSSLKTCGEDHDSRIDAFVESLKNPTLICSNSQFQFEVEVQDKTLKLTVARFFALDEKQGTIFKNIAAGEALMAKTTGSDCPIEITQKNDPTALHMHICMKELNSDSANYQIHDPVKDQTESNILRCKDVNGFAKAADLKN